MLLQLLVPGCCRKEICSVLTTLRTLISDNLYRSITLLYNIPIEFPNRKRIAAKAAAKAPHNTTPSAKARMQAAKAPRKLCESKPGLYKKVIGVFEAAHMAHGSQNAGCGSAAQAVAEESPEYRRSKTRWLNWRVQDG